MPAELLPFIMGLTVFEWLLLSLLYWRGQSRDQALTPTQLFVCLAPGFLLVLAFWVSYDQSLLPWPAVACLAAAGLIHAWDMIRRYRAV
ncbi:MAG: hypothetical protein ACO24G_09880 [Burkholderiaceae bacterium]